jgi:AAA+ ATPase superfamily predicted ATPase
MRKNNPFILRGYHGASTFCDREKETKAIVSAIENHQDITLFANRRLGKSALIQHVFHSLKAKYNCIYADLWGTVTVQGFTRVLATAIIQSDLLARQSFSKKVTDFIKAIGASISVGMDGRPSIDVMFHDNNQIFRNIGEIFYFLEGLKVPVVLAIDEFQEIRKYDEVPLEAKLRTLVQQSKNIRFVFCGSEKHIIHNIFNEYNQPFYQSTRMMELGKIDGQCYLDFIINHFELSRKFLPQEVARFILDFTHRHTYYVQAICNYIFSIKKPPRTIADFELAYRDFLLEKQVFYEEIPNHLTKQQFRCLKAIAHEGLVKSTTSRDFLNASGVKNPSSMQRVIKSLIEKQFLIKEGEKYRLYDVFLEHYLKLKL